MKRHLDSQWTGELRAAHHGQDAGADGNQSQGCLVDRAFHRTWKAEREVGATGGTDSSLSPKAPQFALPGPELLEPSNPILPITFYLWSCRAHQPRCRQFSSAWVYVANFIKSQKHPTQIQGQPAPEHHFFSLSTRRNLCLQILHSINEC